MPEREGSAAALLRLLTWLSPAFPVGAFSYSHGLERAVHDGLVGDAAGLRGWVTALVESGSGWNDAVLLAESWRRAADNDAAGLRDAAELAEALAGSAERHLESVRQGEAFLDAARAWPQPATAALPRECPYAVAVGALSGAQGIPLNAALAAFLQAFVSNMVQAAIRLGVTGQGGAVATVASLETLILATAGRAAASSLDDLGSDTICAEIAAMRHETQQSRLFRS